VLRELEDVLGVNLRRERSDQGGFRDDRVAVRVEGAPDVLATARGDCNDDPPGAAVLFAQRLPQRSIDLAERGVLRVLGRGRGDGAQQDCRSGSQERSEMRHHRVLIRANRSPQA
jgi:hypothetical protein